MSKQARREEIAAGKVVTVGKPSSSPISSPAADPVAAAWDEVKRLTELKKKLQAEAQEAQTAASSCEQQLGEKQGAYDRLRGQANKDWEATEQARAKADEAISEAKKAQDKLDEAISKAEHSIDLAEKAEAERNRAKQAHAESQDALMRANNALETCRSELDEATRNARALQSASGVTEAPAERVVVDKGRKPPLSKFEGLRRRFESLKK